MPEKEKIIKEEHTEERGGSYTPYYLDLGTFEESNEGSYKNSKSGKENNPFKWKVIEEYDNFDDAYKGYRAYIQKQMNYDREDLEKVWASGRIDLRLRHGPKMLDWTGMYVREANVEEEDAKQIKGKDPIEAQKERDSAVCLRDAADMVDELNDRALSHLYNLFSHETIYVLEGGVMENINPEMATESANGIYHLVYKITNFTTSVSEEKPVVNAGKLVTNYSKYNISPETVKKFFKIDERVKIQIDNSKSYILSFAISDFNKEKIESAHSQRDSASFALHIQCTPVEVEEEFNKYLESESDFQEDSIPEIEAQEQASTEAVNAKSREAMSEIDFGPFAEYKQEYLKYLDLTGNSTIIPTDTIDKIASEGVKDLGGKLYKPEDPEEFRILYRRINKHLMNEFAKKRVLPSDRERREEIRQGIAERSGVGPNQSRSGPLRSNKFNLYDPKGLLNKKEPRQWGKKL